MTYTIPLVKLEKLTKKLATISKKCEKYGCDFTFAPVSDAYFTEVSRLSGELISNVEVQDFEVSGIAIINGWEFLATIDHTQAGNIVLSVGEVDTKWRTAEPHCDHCHTKRDRKITYLVKNVTTGEVRQVGKSCLTDYTGIDAEAYAAISQFLNAIKEYEFDEDDEMFREPDMSYYYADAIIARTLALVKNEGYNKQSYIEKVTSPALEVNVNDYAKEVENFRKWLMSLNSSNDYIYNCQVLVKSNYVNVRYLNFIGSIVNKYYQESAEKERLSKDKSNTYVGEIGQRITIKMKSYKALFTSSNEYKSYYAEDTTTYSILDEEGHTYIWSTTTRLNDKVEEITATIKGYKEYKGVKQTVITKGKVTKAKMEFVGKLFDTLVNILRSFPTEIIENYPDFVADELEIKGNYIIGGAQGILKVLNDYSDVWDGCGYLYKNYKGEYVIDIPSKNVYDTFPENHLQQKLQNYHLSVVTNNKYNRISTEIIKVDFIDYCKENSINVNDEVLNVFDK